MLRLRLIFGFSLAGLIIGLMLVDARLSEQSAQTSGSEPAGGLERWLRHGAICAALLSVLVLLAARELVRFARAEGYHPSATLAEAGAVALVLAPYVSFNWSAGHPPADTIILPLLAILLALAFLRQALLRRTQQAFTNVATTMFIVVYLGGLSHFLCRLRMEVGGKLGVLLLLYSMFIVKMTDTGAYFTGRYLGRHKLIAWLSPGKTWEGLIGGILVALVCAVGIGYWLNRAWLSPRLAWEHPLIWLGLFGLMIAGLSIAGDLCASLLKRDAAVKDSGTALPGLGGVLDVLDSPLLAAPAAWLFWTHLLRVSAGG